MVNANPKEGTMSEQTCVLPYRIALSQNGVDLRQVLSSFSPDTLKIMYRSGLISKKVYAAELKQRIERNRVVAEELNERLRREREGT
jgi:hypothetical protein